MVSDAHHRFAALVSGSALSDDDKSAWLDFADMLGGSDVAALLERAESAPGALKEMNDELKLKQEYIRTGDSAVLERMSGQSHAE
ncbi:MAG TPA: hypothetical protein VD862_04385 [Candidatus Paceibacterota bacterium]|nr:hypothetical protein [Candidatus Paceibacterota bacterium]